MRRRKKQGQNWRPGWVKGDLKFDLPLHGTSTEDNTSLRI